MKNYKIIRGRIRKNPEIHHLLFLKNDNLGLKMKIFKIPKFSLPKEYEISMLYKIGQKTGQTVT